MSDLDRHAPLHKVVSCMLKAIQNLSGNEYIYADDAEDNNIHIEEVEVIIQHLSYTDACAINISDNARILEDSI
jgi:hypothetical protein